MTAIEAIKHCLGLVHDVPESGCFHSQVVYDVHGQPHWIEWSERHGPDAVPRLCSQSFVPFVRSGEPYRTSMEKSE